MISISETVKARQTAWAQRRGIAIDNNGYTTTLTDNLYANLSDDTRNEFMAADGGELGRTGERGKMQALHSSSALACNVFEYWRGRDCSNLATVLGLHQQIRSIRFEHKFPTGLPGNAPNLDVVLTLADDAIIAIESKFLEPYSTHTSGFKPKYFAPGVDLWKQANFPNCQRFAMQLNSGAVKMRWLHAEQLLKHVLGLSRHKSSKWSLIYLWYEAVGTAAQEHAAEISEIERVMAADHIDFRAATYQTLFMKMMPLAQVSDQGYCAYLEERYF